MNEALARILEREGYIAGFERAGEGVEESILVRLKYGKDRERTITGLKPGDNITATYTCVANSGSAVADYVIVPSLPWLTRTTSWAATT